MAYIDFSGLLILAVVVFFAVIRRIWEQVKRRQNPELYEAEKHKQEETLRNFLKSLEVDMAEEDTFKPAPKPRVEPPPPPPQPKAAVKIAPKRIVQDEYRFTDRLEHYRPETSVDKRKLKTAIEDRYKDYTGERIISPELRSQRDAYTEKRLEPPSRGRQLIGHLRNKRDMVVLFEILHKPKGY